MKYSGIGRLAHVLDSRSKRVIGKEVDAAASYGEIKANDGLKVDDFAIILPAGTYSVCESIQELSEGDRVLVVWVNGEPCIVDRIAS